MMKLSLEQKNNKYCLEFSDKQRRASCETFDFKNMKDMIDILLETHYRQLNYEFLRVEGHFE